MKIVYSIIIVLFLFSINTFCQKASLQELIKKTECNDIDCFNNFIKEKGFSADKSIKKQKGIKIHSCYNADSSISAPTNEKDLKPNYICFSKISEEKTKIDFGTSIKSNYRSFLAELDDLKFKPIKSTGEANKQITLYYNSDQYPKIKVIVTATNGVDTIGEGKISYLFEVCRN